MSKFFGVVGVVYSTVNLIFGIIAMAADQWETRTSTTKDNKPTAMNAGLWYICENGKCVKRDDGWVFTVQIAGILGIVMTAFSVAMQVASLRCLANLPYWLLVIFNSVEIVGAICTLVEFTTYVQNTGSKSHQYGYCFELTVSGFALSLAGWICTCISWGLVDKIMSWGLADKIRSCCATRDTRDAQV